MASPSIAVALLALVVLVETSGRARLPVGLLLAIAVLATGMDPALALLLGALGATVARGLLAARARGDHRRSTAEGEAAAARRALQEQLGVSRAYARTTFLLGAMPAVPPTFSFPLLGAMRGPIWPALAGSFVGRLPVLGATMVVFAGLARAATDSDETAARLLAIVACILLVVRLVALVDRDHHARTGGWRLREPNTSSIRLAAKLGGAAGAPHAGGAGAGRSSSEDLVIEGELLGEDVEPPSSHDDDDDGGPPSLPPTGLAPS